MPIINVKMTSENGGATKQQKELLVKKLTDAFVEVFKRGKTTCIVTIDEIDTDNYAIGGRTITTIREGK